MENRWPGFGPADILLPKNCDLSKWSVVACDQYTSQNEYVKAPNLCICLQKPIDTHSGNVLSCSHRNKVL